MTTALIADDEPHLAKHLGEQLQKLWPELQFLPVGAQRRRSRRAHRRAAARPGLPRHQDARPVGLEVAQGIEGRTRVVFVTAFDEFAVKAFEQEALDYVLKPVSAQRLAQTVERIQRALADCKPGRRRRAPGQRLAAPVAAAGTAPRLRYVRASQGELTHQIDVAEVLYFRADDKYTCVQTASGEHLIRTPIAELAAQLDPEQFWQVHRSTLINLRFVAGTRRDELSRLFVRLHGHPAELPVSRAYVHLFKAM